MNKSISKIYSKIKKAWKHETSILKYSFLHTIGLKAEINLYVFHSRLMFYNQDKTIITNINHNYFLLNAWSFKNILYF